MKQVGRFGLWVPEDSDAPDGPTQISQLVDGTGTGDGLNHQLARAGAFARKKIITAEQFTESTTYTLLGTADEVVNIPVDEDGLIFLQYTALAKTAESGANYGYAGIFIDNAQAKVGSRGAEPVVQGARILSTNQFGFLFSDPVGLVAGSSPEINSTRGTAPVIAGALSGTQVIIDRSGLTTVAEAAGTKQRYGGITVIENLAAGEYDVSIRWKVDSGAKVTAKDRRLRVWTRSFS